MTSDILFEEVIDREGYKLGKIILNRPKALNAISHDMFLALKDKLCAWEKDEAVKAVLIKSSSEKAFSAGGDIRAAYQNKERPVKDAIIYFELEYSINALIYHFSKPYISLLNGITMGGGVGISIHGSHSIGTENLTFAMPETLIGLFPDVGASFYLSQMPAGYYLGLTGQSIGIDDAVRLGLVGHYVKSEQLDALEAALSETPFASTNNKAVLDIIKQFQSPPGFGELDDHLEEISHCFQYQTIDQIISSLASGSDWAKGVLKSLLKRSPTSVKVTLVQFNRAKNMDFDQVIEQDLVMMHHFLQGHDFFEGVRAAVIDKDKNPEWQPSRLEDVSDEVTAGYFKKI